MENIDYLHYVLQNCLPFRIDTIVADNTQFYSQHKKWKNKSQKMVNNSELFIICLHIWVTCWSTIFTCNGILWYFMKALKRKRKNMLERTSIAVLIHTIIPLDISLLIRSNIPFTKSTWVCCIKNMTWIY